MKNWKRVVAALGAAVLIGTSVGSVPQVVYAEVTTEDLQEGDEPAAGPEQEIKDDSEKEPEEVNPEGSQEGTKEEPDKTEQSETSDKDSQKEPTEESKEEIKEDSEKEPEENPVEKSAEKSQEGEKPDSAPAVKENAPEVKPQSDEFETGDEELKWSEYGTTVTLENNLPENGELVVKSKDNVTVPDETVIAAYDISILVDGDEKEPNGEVTVTITDDALTDGDAIDVYHFVNDSEEATLVRSNVTVSDHTVSFTSSSFSVFALTDASGNEIALDIASIDLADTIAQDGTITATFKDSNGNDITENVIANKDSLTFTWTRSDGEEADSDAVSYDEDGCHVNVVKDAGAQVTYNLTVSLDETEVSSTNGVKVNYYTEFQNNSFESPTISGGYAAIAESNAGGWRTTASDHVLEYGTYAYSPHGAQNDYSDSSVNPQRQYAELDANEPSALYQDVLTDEGALSWSLMHRARTDGGTATDTMYAVIMSAEDADYLLTNVSSHRDLLSKIQSVSTDGTADELTINGKTLDITAWRISTTSTRGRRNYTSTASGPNGESSESSGWARYSSTYDVPAGQYLTRFFFVSTGTSSTGNLLDEVYFDQNVDYEVEYWVYDAASGQYQKADTQTGSVNVGGYANTTGKVQSYTDNGYIYVGAVEGAGSADAVPNASLSSRFRVSSGNTRRALYFRKDIINVSVGVTGLGEGTDLGDYKVTARIYDEDGNTVGSAVEFSGYDSEDTISKVIDGSDLVTGKAYTIKITSPSVTGYTLTTTVGNTTVGKDGYTFNYNGKNDIAFTNTYTRIAKVDINTSVTWNDNGNADGNRPTSIQVKITGTNDSTQTITITDGDDWKKAVKDLPQQNADGEDITYTLTVEGNYPGYTFKVDNDTYTITGNYKAETVAVNLTTVWEDDNDRDGVRPDSYTVTINGSDYTVDQDDTTLDLPKYKDGKAVTYTADAIKVGTVGEAGDYTSAVTGNAADGFKVTNTHTSATTSVTTGITWVDNNNQDGKRPTTVEVTLKGSDGSKATRTLTSTNNWQNVVFSDLPSYNNGQKVTYTIEDVEIEDYDVEIVDNQITATHTADTVTISLDNTWIDSNNQDGIRPGAVSVAIKNGNKTVRTVTLTADGNWGDVIKGLPQYENGTEIHYTVELTNEIEGYTTEIISNDETHTYTIQNTHKAETVDFGSVTGGWKDADNQDGIRPETTTVTLYKNGEPTSYQVTIDKDGKVTGSIGEQPRYENGKEITYTLVPTAQNGYTTKVTDDGKGNYTVTYTHDPEKAAIAVNGAWDDADDQDGKRPENGTRLYLYADGEATVYSVILNEDGTITGKFPRVPVYKAGEVGQPVVYTIVPEQTDDYQVAASVKVVDGEATVTYTHTPETVDFTNANITGVWDDEENRDDKRPETTVVRIYKDGKDTGETVTIDKDGKVIDGSTGDLPRYENGKEITYTLVPTAPAGYEAEAVQDPATGEYTVTYTHEPDTMDITVTGAWEDDDNRDDSRPENGTRLYLYADGVKTSHYVTLLEDGTIDGTYPAVPVNKAGEVGQPVVYTIVPENVDEYNITETDSDGVVTIIDGKATVTYNRAIDMVAFPIDPADWQDNNDQDGKRPGKIVVRLYRNGEPVEGQTVIINEDGSVEGEIDDQAVDEEGKVGVPYDYELRITTENGAEVDENSTGYTYEITRDEETGRYTPVLRHAPARTTIRVSGGWDDADNQDGKRPGVRSGRRLPRLMLFANGVNTGKYVTLNEDGEIENAEAFEDLDVYADGKEIVYTLQFDNVADYSVENAESQTIAIVDGKAVITYQHTPETVNIDLDGVWDDSNNQDGKRIPVTVELVRNGVPTGKTVTIDKEGNVVGTFGEYDAYENGNKITYTFNTTLPDGYEAEVVRNADGSYTITYSYTPEQHHDAGDGKSHDNGHREGGVGQINYYLVDQTTGQPLAGARVSLYKSNGAYVGTYTTDANGYIGIKGAEASTYYFAEVQAPNGYVLSSDKVNFQLFGNESVSVSQTNVALSAVTADNAAAADQAAINAANAANAADAAAGAGVADANGAAGNADGTNGAAVSGTTGDESNMMLYGAAVIAAAGILILWFARNRRRASR